MTSYTGNGMLPGADNAVLDNLATANGSLANTQHVNASFNVSANLFLLMLIIIFHPNSNPKSSYIFSYKRTFALCD